MTREKMVEVAKGLDTEKLLDYLVRYNITMLDEERIMGAQAKENMLRSMEVIRQEIINRADR